MAEINDFNQSNPKYEKDMRGELVSICRKYGLDESFIFVESGDDAVNMLAHNMSAERVCNISLSTIKAVIDDFFEGDEKEADALRGQIAAVSLILTKMDSLQKNILNKLIEATVPPPEKEGKNDD